MLMPSFLAIPVAYVSIRHHSFFKKHRYHPDEKHHLNEGNGGDMRFPDARALDPELMAK
jgi:hypothetical protein